MWDNQLQMTMVETIIIVCCLTALLFVELYRTDPRTLLHKPSDEPRSFTEIFKKSGGSSKRDMGDLKLSLTGIVQKPKVKRVAVTAIMEESSDRSTGIASSDGA